MPNLTNSLPKYRRHKVTGQAIVTLMGRDIYLGPHGSKVSKTEYDRLIGEWLAAGRPIRPLASSDITVVELAAKYKKFARTYYRKARKSTGTAEIIERTLKSLCERYGRTNANEFGPLALQSMQQEFIEMGQSRRYINDNIDRIRRMFRWGVANELVEPEVAQALAAVPGLKKDRTGAREAPPVRPVDNTAVEATLPHLPEVVADMVRFQRLTGCRPGEVCILRPMDLDRTGDVWLYRPGSHKTEHLGRERAICIGPKAQDILRPYLLRPGNTYCFAPKESEKKRLVRRHERRRTPLHYGNRPGTNCRRKPRKTLGDRYDTNSYRRAIHRAVDLINRKQEKEAKEERRKPEVLPKWSPNRLRHAAATEIRKRFGLEAAQVTLGHAAADVSQIYAERDLDLARRVAGEVG